MGVSVKVFYVKHEAEGVSAKINVTDENVFTDCPQCGEATKIDLEDYLRLGDNDLCDSVYCDKCSAAFLQKRHFYKNKAIKK